MTLTKDRIVLSLQNQPDISRSGASRLVESTFEILKGALASGEDVLISGFRKFSVREKNERKGRNPATGDDLPLKARRVVTFRCSPRLKDRLNGGDFK